MEHRFKTREYFYRLPANRRLKRIALAVICVAILLLFTAAFLFDSLSWKIILILRGSAGVCAIAFVVLYTVLVWRVNKAFINQPHVPRRRFPDS